MQSSFTPLPPMEAGFSVGRVAVEDRTPVSNNVDLTNAGRLADVVVEAL